MSGGSAQQAASAQLQGLFASEGTALANIGLPAINDVLNQYFSDLGTPGSEPGSIQKLFSQARDSVGANFGAAEQSSNAAIATRARSMGLDYVPGAVKAAQDLGTQSLEGQKNQAINQLNFQEGTMGLSQTESLLARMGRIESVLAAGATGAGNNALNASQFLPRVNPWESAAGGALSGAATGASIPGAGWYGAAAGAIIGGASGYFGAQ